jgi:hypothetical protein
MPATEAIDQVKIRPDDEHVRCGPARFTLFLSELRVRFDGSDRAVNYDLGSIPFNQASLLCHASGRPTWFLVCNQWGSLHVRYGPLPAGKRYPALRAKQYPRQVTISEDLFAEGMSSSAMHPDPDVPVYVKLFDGTASIHVHQGGLTAFEFKVKVKSLPLGQWVTPRDKHGQPLPLRLRRPALAALFGAKMLDIEWMD